MYKLIFLVCVPLLAESAPQREGFGDASDQDIAEIRAGTYLETFDEQPQYNFNYKVADEVEQTYLAMEESRDADVVTGTYSYVDPFGSLITVTYTAGPMGYSETRDVQEGFVQIRARPASSSSGFSAGGSSSGSALSSSSGSGSSSFSSGGSGSSSFSSRPQSSSSLSSNSQQSSFSSSSNNNLQSDIVSAVVSQVQPLISQTVSSAVSGASRRTATAAVLRPVAPAPAAPADDIVSQVVSSIQPLVSQTVSSAVSGSGFASRPSARAPAPAPVLAPAPASAPFPAPAPAPASIGSVSDLFGTGGNFNVRFNTPSFNIEY